MSTAKRKILRNVFWMLFVLLTAACVVLNIKIRESVEEEDCQQITVTVANVKKEYISNALKRYTDVELIKVNVLYQGKEYKLRGAVNYDRFVKLKGHTYDALLYKDKIYYDLPSAQGGTTIGVIYWICLASDFACLLAAAKFSSKESS